MIVLERQNGIRTQSSYKPSRPTKIVFPKVSSNVSVSISANQRHTLIYELGIKINKEDQKGKRKEKENKNKSGTIQSPPTRASNRL